MAGVNESTEFIEEVYQLETEDPVLGGPDGISNLQAKALASRTKWLRAIIAEICASEGIVLNNAQTGQLLTALDTRYFKNQNLPAQATDAELLVAIQAHNNAGDPHPQYQKTYTRAWSNQTSNRSFGSVYTNTTGEEIDVSILDLTIGQPTYIYARQNIGSPWQVVSGNSTDGNYGWMNFCYAPIPPTWQYYVQASGGGLQMWAELRKV